MIDFHTHSTFSDGRLSPEDLVVYAKEKGLCMLALTDHDTVSGLQRAKNAAALHKLAFIPGIELSAQNGGELHILGLSIDPSHATWNTMHYRMQRSRESRNTKIIKSLKQLGIILSMEDLYRQAEGSVSRVHIACCLVEKGICADIDEAFNVYLSSGGKAYQARDLFSAQECIDMIHQAGGVAVVAHLHTADITGFSSRMAFMEHMKTLGIDGLECYYHNYTATFSQECMMIARKLGLLMTGGSDFHGENKSNQIGKTLLGNIPAYLYDEYYKNR